ncbi:MAG: hypothetical protein H0T11_07145 [Chthoniobacterales bacterium]|nr:hypothetical protein [Chthoniobacterales bacterium]
MSTARFFAPAFRAKLRACCTRLKAGAIHTVPHAGVDFSAAQEVAHELGVPLFLSVHDDLAYTAAGAASASSREAAMRAAWNAASARFVISDSLGEEYCRRYGQHSYQVVTDGLTQVHVPRAVTSHARLHIYFMGLFHMAYERNLRALLDALAILKREEPALDVTVLLRCEHVRAHVTAGEIPVKVLPFGDEAQVQRDMETADLLYMPLHFGDEHANFARYSLSTKMVTYIGSGLPILYHGPDNSAAYSLLSKHRSAITITTLAPDEIASALRGLDPQTRHEVAANAAALAERDFMLTSQTERFWGTIGREMGRA